MEHAQINDATLAYRDLGAGDPILFIHGGLIADALLPVAEAPTVSSYRRIQYHRRGCGESTRPDPARPITLAEQAEDAAGLLDHLGVATTHVVGHSGGALMALILAAQEPARVQSLTLIESLAPLSSASGAEFVTGMAQLMELYASGDAEGTVHRFFGAIWKPDWQDLAECAVPGAVAQAVRGAPTAFECEFPGLDWDDGLHADQVAAIRCPVLSVLATETGPLFVDGRVTLHDWFPWCEDADIEGGSHMVPMEQPGAVAEAIASFLPQRRAHHPPHPTSASDVVAVRSRRWLTG